MGPTSMIPLFCSLLIVSAGALDILQILKSDSNDYSTFAKLLTDTKLVDEINSRQTITVLALNNGAVGAITSLPSNLQKEVLSLHVILDYYDPVKLDALKQKTVLLTTLFQSSGQATGQMGFLNYTELPNEKQVFGSAVPGAPLDSNLIGVVAARPYNISVLQVSKAIIPPGLNGAGKAPPPTPSAKSNATSPTPSSNATSPAPANATKPPTGSTTPSSGNATAPSSGNATTPSPKSAPTPSGSTAAPAPKDSADAPANNDASPPTDSKATPPTQAASPSSDEVTPPTSGDQTSPTEAPSGSATEAPTTAEGPAEANGPATGASSPVSTDVSDAPADGPTAGVPDSDKTSAAGKAAARSIFRLVAMGLVLIGAL